MRIIRHIFYEEAERIMLSINHVTKIYFGNKKAVDDISFDILYGGFVGCICP
ncbi:osmoprotectant, partial [Escherichia coli]|nr:osmoprotectant [Escherichia coli]